MTDLIDPTSDKWIDHSFSAHCPKCDSREWRFPGSPDGAGVNMPDIKANSRICNKCGYQHWLRGTQHSATIEPPHMRVRTTPSIAEMDKIYDDIAKKHRVERLVFALLSSPNMFRDPSRNVPMMVAWKPEELVGFALAIDIVLTGVENDRHD